MNRSKVCIISQFPPPMHGLSKAVDTIVNSYLNNKYDLEIIDTKNNKAILKTIYKIMISDADLFYFTISQSVGGNLRDLLILKLLRFQKKKCLIHLHGGDYRKLIENDVSKIQKKMNYRAIKGLDGVIVLSASLKSIFEGMITPERIFTVENCADDEFILPEEDARKKCETLINKSEHRVLYLSNFIKEKGYREVLNLALLEKKRVENSGEKKFHFHFAGKFFDQEEEYFNTFVSRHNLTDYVTLHGVVGGEKKQHLLRECDMFILPTRYPNEGQPISILEAMGNAMFIITTDHAGIPDVVQDGKNGVVATADITIEQLYARMLSQKDLQDVCYNNYTLCVSRFSQSNYLASVDKVWSILLREDSSRRTDNENSKK